MPFEFPSRKDRLQIY